MVVSAQDQVRRLTESYLRANAQLLGAVIPEGTGMEAPAYPRFGVTPLEVWSRPAETFRYMVSKGNAPSRAKALALKRVEAMAEKEVALAQRDQSAVFAKALGIEQESYGFKAPEKAPARPAAPTAPKGVKVIGYRRIVHPELSRTGTCGLCMVAATRIYTLGELMPLHDNCKCTVAFVTETEDPGEALNNIDLSQLYGKAGSTSAKDLSAVRVATYTSGELGPVLTRGGVEVKDGETRKKRKLAPREQENKVTGDDAEKASEPKSTPDKARALDLEISSYEQFIARHADDVPMAPVVEKYRLMLHKRRRERALLK